jgi:FkbM family methyltransferase
MPSHPASIQSRSQYGQDLVVDDFLQHQTGGFFLDIGAHNGVSLSNSWFFEKHRGWKGICVEPNPSVYDQLTKNRSCQTVNGCISKDAGIVTFAKVTGSAEMLSGIAADYDERHLERIQREVKADAGQVEYISVPAFSVNELLQRSGVRTVDYCSIDTEGGELKILQSIDFGRFHFRVLSVENNYRSKAFRRLLTTAGFELLCFASCDELYANRAELAARPRSPYKRMWLKQQLRRFMGLNSDAPVLKHIAA